MASYVNIPTASSGGSCEADPWADTAGVFVVGKVSTLTNACFRSRCATAFTQELERSAVTGTGADVTVDTSRNGGVIVFDSGTTGNSFRILRNTGAMAAAGLKNDFVANMRTQKWAIVVRCLVGTVGAGATMDILCMSDETTGDVSLGVRGVTSTANWAIAISGQATQNTTVALPTAAFATIAWIADGTNVTGWNVDSGVQIGTPAAQSNAAAAAGHLKMICLNTAAASNQFRVDDIAVFTEPAS